MALRIHRQDQHGNVVAEEGLTLCTCGCKYWENDKCIDCGMTPERLWIIQSAQNQRLLMDFQINTAFTTMLHYDLPWVKTGVSEKMQAENITARLMDAPDYGLTWAKPSDCRDCGGTDNDHYLSCHVWDFNKKVA